MAFWMPFIAAAGSILGKIGEAKANGRVQQANANLNQDEIRRRANADQQQALIAQAQLAERGALDRAQLDLQRRAYADQAPGARARQAVVGNLLANMRDASFSRPAGAEGRGLTGGLRPSALGPGGRAAGEELARQAMMRLMKGDSFDPVPATQMNILPQITPTPQPKAGFMDKLLGVAGVAGGLAGAYNLANGPSGPLPSSANPPGTNMPIQFPPNLGPLVPSSGNGVPNDVIGNLISQNWGPLSQPQPWERR